MSFIFDYTIKDADRCIVDTEEELRNLVYQVMNRRYGLNWEYEVLDSADIEILEKTRKGEKKRLPDQRVSERLLDYGYIPDLKNIICSDNFWPEFQPIFKSRDTTLVYLDQLGIFRNPTIHKRSPGIMEHQKELCVGMCGELSLRMHRRKMGFKHRINGYHCEFSFSIEPKAGEDEKAAKSRARAEAEKWLKGVEKLSDKTPQIKQIRGLGNSGLVDASFIRMKEGDVYIAIVGDMKMSDGTVYYDTIVDVYCNSVKVLDRIVSELGHPYWVIHWLTKDPIDVRTINAQIHQLSRATLEPRSTSANKFQNSLDMMIIHNYNDLPSDGIERMKKHESVRVVAGHSLIQNSGSSIGLVFDGKSENSFFRAHSIFNPDDIISILLGEVSISQIRRMLKDSRTPPNLAK